MGKHLSSINTTENNMSKLLSYIVLAACVLFIGTANAATSFTFAPATNGTYVCPSYCMGFTTSDPAHTVDFVTIGNGPMVLVGGVWTSTYTLTLGIDGVTYRGTSMGSGQSFSAPGLMASVTWTSSRTCTHSGRGQTCTTRHYGNTGSVAL